MKLFRRATLTLCAVIIILICMMIPRTQSRMMNGYSYLPPSENGNGKGNGGPPIGIIKLDGKLNKDGSYMVSFWSLVFACSYVMQFLQSLPISSHFTH